LLSCFRPQARHIAPRFSGRRSAPPPVQVRFSAAQGLRLPCSFSSRQCAATSVLVFPLPKAPLLSGVPFYGSLEALRRILFSVESLGFAARRPTPRCCVAAVRAVVPRRRAACLCFNRAALKLLSSLGSAPPPASVSFGSGRPRFFSPSGSAPFSRSGAEALCRALPCVLEASSRRHLGSVLSHEYWFSVCSPCADFLLAL
jgi:hypothetical protein